MSAVPRQFIG